MNFADCACFVPEPGQNIHLPLSKKKQAAGDTVHSERRRSRDFAAYLARNAGITQIDIKKDGAIRSGVYVFLGFAE